MPNSSLKGLNLSLKESKAVAKERGIKYFKIMSEDKLLSALQASELLKEKRSEKSLKN